MLYWRKASAASIISKLNAAAFKHLFAAVEHLFAVLICIEYPAIAASKWLCQVNACANLHELTSSLKNVRQAPVIISCMKLDIVSVDMRIFANSFRSVMAPALRSIYLKLASSKAV